MDIQGYIIGHWLGKMSAERFVLVIYDLDWLPLLYKKTKSLASVEPARLLRFKMGLNQRPPD